MLLYFYGNDCKHCEEMNNVIKRLEDEDFLIEWQEVFDNKDNEAVMISYDKDRCGGVPFFYNTETDKYICGEAGYLEARALAVGE